MILGIIQARMSSTRLPGKVLRVIKGKPMLQWQIERLRNVRGIDELVVATSTDESDDPIGEFCAAAHVECFRGSLHDVLDRFYRAAKYYRASHIVRWTGDCPLIDPELSDHVIALHLRSGCDYTSNTLPRTYADGLDTEVITRDALMMAHLYASSVYDREHVTPYIYQRPAFFKLASLKNDKDESNIRWTVDREEDIPVIEQLLGDTA